MADNKDEKKVDEAEEELVDFEEDGENQEVAAEKKEGAKAGTTYVAVNIAGFRDFLLKPELNRAITDNGFEHPSEVQHQCIPQAILGQDIIAQAKSGMGKTAVFVLSTLHQLEDADEKFVQCMVMVHTRELAFQIKREYVRFAKYITFAKIAVFYGGINIGRDKEILRRGSDDFPNIVVATPGRALALTRDGDLQLNRCKFFVLDEADRLLEKLDMRKDVQEVFVTCPASKQVMMFSATLPKDIRETAKKFMKDPLEIYVDSQSKLTLHGLQQYSSDVDEHKKNRKLTDLLDSLEFNQVVIFVRSRDRCEQLHWLLTDCGFPCTMIHGSMDQEERIKTYQSFKDFKSRICVATDLFGRGIDIERVNIVIQYDMAPDPDTYLHRVGRAGRFGTKGLAICFLGGERRGGYGGGGFSDLSDKEVMRQVQDRFEVEIKPLPDKISVDSYMQS